jgi:hypothetical protein
MKKVSTAAVRQSNSFSEQKLTIGLDLGDRSSWYCVLDGLDGNFLLDRFRRFFPGASPQGRWSAASGGEVRDFKVRLTPAWPPSIPRIPR